MVLIPGPTTPGPGQALVDLVGIAHELVGRVLARRDRVDVLGRDLADPPQDVVGRPGHGGYQGAVADGRVGPREDEVVRELRAGDAQVALGFGRPFLRERGPVAARDRVVWDV